MNKQNRRPQPLADCAASQESRTSRFNLPVRHPARWRFIADQLLSSPLRLHRYRNLSVRMFEDAVRKMDSEQCQ